MTSSQQQAAVHVAEILLDAIQRVGPEREGQREKPRRPAAPRYSQLAFIDGDRGMGKTSLLLSFQHLAQWSLSSEARVSADNAIQTNIPFPKPISDLIENRNRIVWLETLDMEPMGKSSDLFVAILVRISAVLVQDQIKSRRYWTIDRRDRADFDSPRSFEDLVGDGGSA